MPKYDKEAVKSAATGHWRTILTTLGNVPPEVLDGRHHPCPKCGGEDRFRAFDDVDETGGLFCNQCHDSQNGDGFASIQWLCNLKFTDALSKVAEYLSVPPIKPKAAPDDGIEWQKWSSELAKFFLAAKPGITEQALLDAGARLGRYKKQYSVIGIPIVGQDLDAEKPVGWALYNYNGGTLPKWKGRDVVGQVKVKITYGSKAGLVGLHAIERLKTEGLPELVWKVEGITDAIALQAAIPEQLRDRHLVVTNSNGAGETPRWQAAVLARCNCNVIHDADKPGQDGAGNWTTQIAAQQSDGLTTRNVELPYEVSADHGKDLRDWLAEGHTYADLLTLADQAAAVVVQKTEAGEIDYSQVKHPVQEKILKMLQIEVLYENEEGAIRVFSSLLRKSSWIRHVERLKREILIQICGAPAKVHISAEPDGDDTFSITDVKEAIAMAAATRRGKEDERGVGVWQGLDDFGNETETMVVVGDTEACRWNGDKVLRRVLAPRVDGLVLDFGAGAKDWYDFDQLNKDMQAAESEAWRRRVIEEAIDLFDLWRWRSQKSDPTLVTGLVLATWVQTIWAWRPLVAVTGESNSGKSYLFEALGGSGNHHGLFGDLAFKQAKSTEAGIRQGVGKTACVILCDEFEQSKDRDAILKVMRTSTRGEMIARGTAGSQKGQQFKLQHIAWVAAIEAGLDKQADNNRFIQLDLLRASDGDHGKLRLPNPSILMRMGQELLATALWAAVAAKDLAIVLKSTKAPGIDPRSVESFAVPAAILSVASGLTEDQSRGVLVEMLESIDKDAQAKSDQDELLNDIMSAPMYLDGKAGKLSVGHVLESAVLYSEHSLRLEACGVRKSDDNHLFLNPRQVKSELLQRSIWANQSIDKILLRLPGAQRAARRMSGRVLRGIEVVVDMFDDGDDGAGVDGGSGYSQNGSADNLF